MPRIDGRGMTFLALKSIWVRQLPYRPRCSGSLWTVDAETPAVSTVSFWVSGPHVLVLIRVWYDERYQTEIELNFTLHCLLYRTQLLTNRVARSLNSGVASA